MNIFAICASFLSIPSVLLKKWGCEWSAVVFQFGQWTSRQRRLKISAKFESCVFKISNNSHANEQRGREACACSDFVIKSEKAYISIIVDIGIDGTDYLYLICGCMFLFVENVWST